MSDTGARLPFLPNLATFFAMTRRVWLVGGIVGVAALVYFLLFIPPNLTGSADPAMLAAFQIDEWLQYPHVMRMTTAGDSWRETARNVFVYQHYFYGFPFYLSSALAILPVRAATAFAPLAESMGDTRTIMLVLRQLSPLFMLTAVALLVYNWTGFRHLGRTLLVMAVLLTAPAVFDNNLWWHAESLTLLWVALTLFALYRDDLAFGRWFVVAAVACGLAAGTKQAGFWFFLAVAVYLALGWRQSDWRATLRRGLLFGGVMALTILLVNPLLVVPPYNRAIIDTQLLQADRISFGWDVAMERGPVSWYQQTLRLTYGHWALYALALVACVWAAVSEGRRRLLAILTLAYVLPFAFYLLFFVAAKPARYFLPVMLPLLAALGYEALYCWDRRQLARSALSAVVVVGLLLQIGVFMQRNSATYAFTLNREATSPALSFATTVGQMHLDQQPPGDPLLVYRDPNVYLPPRPGVEVVMSWDLPSFEAIDELDPDLILLQQSNISRYADPEFVRSNYRPEQARRNAAFYAAAVADAVPGYRQLVVTDFGLALVRAGPGDQ